ncbi:MAG: tRNA (adenosine(37)-N6)-threonylcarbamoyltransferase complex ATPase subunit type 1 TsaE [Gammaproteobacteria bacterium]|uniref:tRNA threonylcarbamoyladenosine biosynthesis protein TsaE n=1 Tax=Candidatus Thiopontia autotrophica TaxID=2841688 RepID=A0A8J6PE76_9GAMM|nr:tRNA (adenosine(37)-N6)-threonylcarbamoyltransferase complex ATPase subunit type 1 TsaE [Candidatus Thiopontia autotrophica]MBL6968741.1 tRNA (adenosine(37)-N6)-threonylcarbamoyltransferase complex ATPase subunit type 1 TsaE [Gammaproteobacteria bacterium]
MILEIADEQQMEQFGAAFATLIKPPALLFLQGDLGMGKTTFSRGFIRELGHRGNVKSPTYTLVEPYKLAGSRVYHFDLYRLCDSEELEFMGIRDYLEDSILLVEWPDRGVDILPDPDFSISLEESGDGRRALCEGDQKLLDAVREQFKRMVER